MYEPLDYDLILATPTAIYMGELPRTFSQSPAEVMINLCGVFPQLDARGRTVLCMALLDALDPALLPDRATLEDFLGSVHLYAQDRPTYWHCHAGINRSGLALSAYLHLYRGMRISDAIALLRQQRTEIVLCNHVFEGLLRTWYGDLDEQEFVPVQLDSYSLGLRPR